MAARFGVAAETEIEMTEKKAMVDAHLFRIVNECASTEETRYYLNGVHIEPHEAGGAVMVATDGHRMIVAHDPEGSCDEPCIVQLPKFMLSQCAPAKTDKGKRRLQVDIAAGSVTIVDYYPGSEKAKRPASTEEIATGRGCIVDGTYPDWRRVVPQKPVAKKAFAASSFNPVYLSAFSRIGRELAKRAGKAGSIQIMPSDGASAAVIRFGGVNDVFGVLMPMRGDVRGFLPDFMAKPAHPVEEAA